jgi:hypothetical protein
MMWMMILGQIGTRRIMDLEPMTAVTWTLSLIWTASYSIKTMRVMCSMVTVTSLNTTQAMISYAHIIVTLTHIPWTSQCCILYQYDGPAEWAHGAIYTQYEWMGQSAVGYSWVIGWVIGYYV